MLGGKKLLICTEERKIQDIVQRLADLIVNGQNVKTDINTDIWTMDQTENKYI